MPISVWNDDTGGTKTITVEGIWGGGAVPDNNDIWIEVEYLGSASEPEGLVRVERRRDHPDDAVELCLFVRDLGRLDHEIQDERTTGTIQQKGPITVHVFAALPSSTFYIDPKLTVT